MTYLYDPPKSAEAEAEADPGFPRGPRGSLFGNALITIAGADQSELDLRSVDRSYYVGMGSAILMTATVSTMSMLAFSSIAFRLKFGSPPSYFFGTLYFLLIVGLDRWLVSDQTTGFAATAVNPLAVAGQWLGHLIVDLFRIAPRVLVALACSLLFTKFLLLVIYSQQIHQQLGKLQEQRVAQYDMQVKGVATEIVNQAQAVISKATTAENAVQHTYEMGRKAINRAYAAEQKNLAAAGKQGYSCSWVPTYSVATNPNTGLQYNVFTGNVQVCPPQLTSIVDAYNKVVAQYPQKQSGVNAQKAKIAAKYGVARQEKIIKDAAAKARQEMGPYKPREEDGLLAREHALGLLTTPPGDTCPPQPTEAQLARDAACTSMYSPGATAEMTLVRDVLLAFEMLPVLMKFINALLPRRAYAWVMAAREAERREAARKEISKARKKAETDVAAFVRRERARLEEEGALQEHQLRELARQERRLGLRRIQSRFTAALANSEPGRVLRDRRNGRKRDVTAADNTTSMSAPVDPRNTQADPGIRVIENEDFLY